MAGKDRDRIVYQRSDNSWVNKRNDADKASSIHKTQSEAVKTAKAMLVNQGGGELVIKGQHGAPIRSKDTIAPGNDPNPPKDKEH
jgi:hypothetical protein